MSQTVPLGYTTCEHAEWPLYNAIAVLSGRSVNPGRFGQAQVQDGVGCECRQNRAHQNTESISAKVIFTTVLKSQPGDKRMPPADSSLMKSRTALAGVDGFSCSSICLNSAENYRISKMIPMWQAACEGGSEQQKGVAKLFQIKESPHEAGINLGCA